MEKGRRTMRKNGRKMRNVSWEKGLKKVEDLLGVYKNVNFYRVKVKITSRYTPKALRAV